MSCLSFSTFIMTVEDTKGFWLFLDISLKAILWKNFPFFFFPFFSVSLPPPFLSFSLFLSRKRKKKKYRANYITPISNASRISSVIPEVPLTVPSTLLPTILFPVEGITQSAAKVCLENTCCPELDVRLRQKRNRQKKNVILWWKIYEFQIIKWGSYNYCEFLLNCQGVGGQNLCISLSFRSLWQLNY